MGSSLQKLIVVGLAALMCWSANALESPLELASIYAAVVDKRLDVPLVEAQRYAGLIVDELNLAGLASLTAQYLLVVDRSPQVQAVFLYWIAPDAMPQLIGASPVSTGRPGRFGYFKTPAGVFDHSVANPDFLENRLGTAQSKGCIRIPATLNLLIDRYGVLDADYERELVEGTALWMLVPRSSQPRAPAP